MTTTSSWIWRRASSMLIATASASLVIGPSSNAASSVRPTCERADGKTIVANTLARAFVRSERLYACATRSRRMLTLGDYLPFCDSASGCSGAGKLNLAGRYLAYEQLDATRDAGSSAVYIVDTRRARVRRVWREGDAASMEYTSVAGLVATQRGGVAWIALSGQTGVPGKTKTRVFRANAGARPEVLDQVQGLDIELDSLALSEGQRSVYWINSGQPRAAPIE